MREKKVRNLKYFYDNFSKFYDEFDKGEGHILINNNIYVSIFLIIIGCSIILYIKTWEFNIIGIIFLILKLMLFFGVFIEKNKYMPGMEFIGPVLPDLLVWISYGYLLFLEKAQSKNIITDILYFTPVMKYMSYMQKNSENIIFGIILFLLLQSNIFLILSIIDIYIRKKDTEKMNLNWMMIIIHNFTNNLADVRYKINYIHHGNEKKNIEIILQKCKQLEQMIIKSHSVLLRDFLNQNTWEHISIKSLIDYIKNYRYKDKPEEMVEVLNDTKLKLKMRRDSKRDHCIFVHKQKFLEVINEILENAIKHKKSGSKVTVEINVEPTYEKVEIYFFNEIEHSEYKKIRESIQVLNMFWENDTATDLPIDKIPFGWTMIRYIIENMRGDVNIGIFLKEEKIFTLYWRISFFYYLK